ncbi:hypothetical protein, partial [Salmonella enterica]|uniref:hypothetical protein n=1 Tax=Salmonella enterica TaxID=28901 RepID=UPI0032B603FA
SALSIVLLAPLNDPAMSLPPSLLPAAVIVLSGLQAVFSSGAWFGWFWMARALAQPLLTPARLRTLTVLFVGLLFLRFALFFAGLLLRLYT